MSPRLALSLLLISGVLPLVAQRPCTAPLGKKTATVGVPGHPFEPVFSNDGCTVFVSLTQEGAVAVLNWTGSGYRLQRTVPIGGRPTGMVLTHDGRTLIAADPTAGAVDLLDTAALASGQQASAVRARVGAGALPGAIYVNVSPDDHYLFVSNERGESVTVIALAGDRIVGAMPAGQLPIALTFSPDGHWLFMTSEIASQAWGWPVRCPRQAQAGRGGPLVAPDGALLVADVATAERDPAHAVVHTVPAGCSPVRLALSPDGATAYVTARSDDAVLAFSTAALETGAANALVGHVGVGTAPVGIAATPDGRWVIATDSNRFARGGGQLDVIPAAAFTAGGRQAPRRRTLTAGSFPRELRVRPDGAVLAVTNFGSSDVEFVNLARALPAH